MGTARCGPKTQGGQRRKEKQVKCHTQTSPPSPCLLPTLATQNPETRRSPLSKRTSERRVRVQKRPQEQVSRRLPNPGSSAYRLLPVSPLPAFVGAAGEAVEEKQQRPQLPNGHEEELEPEASDGEGRWPLRLQVGRAQPVWGAQFSLGPLAPQALAPGKMRPC